MSAPRPPRTLRRRRCVLGGAAAFGSAAAMLGLGAAGGALAQSGTRETREVRDVRAPAARGDIVHWPTVTLLDGRSLGPADFTGRAAVVVFWSVTCPYCRRHNRHVQKLQAKNLPGLVVLGVSRDADAGEVRRHMAAEGYTFAVTLDAEPMAAALTRRRLVPQTATIGRDGRLQWLIPGEMSEEDVLELARLASPR